MSRKRENMVLKRRIYKSMLSLFFMVMFFLLSVPVLAKEEGTITVQERNIEEEHKPVEGGCLAIFQIAEGNRLNGTGKAKGNFEEAFQKGLFSMEADVLSSRETSKKLENFVREKDLQPIEKVTTDKNGNGIFADLGDGIYLIVPCNTKEDFERLGYIIETEPYIVELPGLDENGNQIYYVTCEPKCKVTPMEKPSEITVEVFKEWKDHSNVKKKRPKTIKVGLFENGKRKQVVTLHAGNNWHYVWKGLKEGRWTVDEIDVPSEYRKEVSSVGTVFTISNIYEPPTSQVKTGDERRKKVWLISMGIAGICIIGWSLYTWKKKKS